MTKSMTITKARDLLLTLPDEMERHEDLHAIEVTRWGKSVLAILPWEEYESIAETREILSDRATMLRLAKGIKEADQGKLCDSEKVRKKLRI